MGWLAVDNQLIERVRWQVSPHRAIPERREYLANQIRARRR